MANLTPTSAAAIARLRAYTAPPTSWNTLALSRRAAVLILLFADKTGELRVVLTERASTLNNYAGQVAFPGGKADTLAETPFITARREAHEEIGLPLPNETISSTTLSSGLPYPWAIDHLTTIPTNLARTELGVVPCVAFLHASAPLDKQGRPVDAEAMLVPRLDAREVAAVFSAPFRGFLRTDLDRVEREVGSQEDAAPSASTGSTVLGGDYPGWYKGTWMDWHETRWRMHNFHVPRDERAVVAAAEPFVPPSLASSSSTPSQAQPNHVEVTPPSYFRVFGMTARILVDCARVAYAEEPDFEHNSHFGDEALIRRLVDSGRMAHERKRGDEFRAGDVAKILQNGGNGEKKDADGRTVDESRKSEKGRL